jgi:mono/diheme cytochrome c family protein
MRAMRLWKILVFGVVMSAPAIVVSAQDNDDYPIPEFTEDFLADPETIATGKDVWDTTCRGCHGASAYPGKAPMLRPRRLNAEIVYDRVTYGFRLMPAWEEVLTEEERMSVAAYVVSRSFSP